MYRLSLLFFLFFCCISTSFAASGLISNPIDSTEKVRQTNIAYNNIFRENLPTLFFGNEYGGPIRTLLVADINPNIVLFSSKNSNLFVAFSPRVQLRLWTLYHSPVKSPSYMPGATIYTRVNDDETHPKLMSLSYTHHSNGQEGKTLDANGEFNRDDGKFTTNFYSLNYYFGKRDITNTSAQIQSAFVGIELHAGLIKTGYSKQLAGKYGFVRTNGSWFYDIANDKQGKDDHYHNRWRVRFDYSYILDKVYDYNIIDYRKRLNASLKYYYHLGFMENSALSVTAGYRGQDPYNIFFLDSYTYFAIGLSAGMSFDLHKKHIKN